ncbi:hypothetical protein SOVF_145750 [Spinacia oleracea]|nr:hypothetical protein SOVF_145750 [Spinacia oleracea]
MDKAATIGPPAGAPESAEAVAPECCHYHLHHRTLEIPQHCSHRASSVCLINQNQKQQN